MWFCDDSVGRAELEQNHEEIKGFGRKTRVALRANADGIRPSVPPAASRMAVVSDVEGDVDYLRRWLLAVGVADSAPAWTYGDGRLVVLGDFVDRGRRVYDLFWFLYELGGKARLAGGDVHLVLGNHEHYGFAGDTNDVVAELLFAIDQIMPSACRTGAVSVTGAIPNDPERYFRLCSLSQRFTCIPRAHNISTTEKFS